jgi:hypothetical protein
MIMQMPGPQLSALMAKQAEDLQCQASNRVRDGKAGALLSPSLDLLPQDRDIARSSKQMRKDPIL